MKEAYLALEFVFELVISLVLFWAFGSLGSFQEILTYKW